MSLTLGEKLRQAREERGLTISEVAEQTRISALYLESIENNDFRPLPGGIFNKGFVKSYAKHVGINEQEALQDYSDLMSQQGENVADEPKTYRPEVLTDEQSRFGLLPTIFFSVVILALLIWGVMAFLKYYGGDPTTSLTNANANNTANTNAPPSPTPTPFVPVNEIKVELKTTSPVWVASTADNKKIGGIIAPDKPATYQPKESLRLSYSKEQAANVQLTVNGKSITLPSAPANPKQNAIEFVITKDNINQILQSGAIAGDAPGAPPNAAAPAATPRR